MSVFTIPAIPIPPLIANYLELDTDYTGAWIGGFVDSTGAVIASASILKEEKEGKMGIKNASMVKMIQNILIGPIALLSIFMIHGGGNVKMGVLWERLPKFVIGFLVTMVMFTVYTDRVRDLEQNVYNGLFFLSEW